MLNSSPNPQESQHRNQARILYILAAVAVLIAMSFGMGFAAEWKAVNTGLTNLEIRSLAIDPASSSTLSPALAMACSRA